MNTDSIDFHKICKESKELVQFTPESERLINKAGPIVIPYLDNVTNKFYDVLLRVPATAKLLEGRVDSLKRTHRAWLESLFTQTIDEDYTQWMHHVGEVHVNVELPVEFMTSGMTLIQMELLEIILNDESLETDERLKISQAIIALCGFSQLVMQKSYSEDTLRRIDAELDRFLAITGMSKVLFENLASAF